MTKLEMQTIVTAVLKAIEGAQATPKAPKSPVKSSDSSLTEGQVKYRKSVAQLLRKKFGKDVDIQWNVNVLTHKKWADQGRKVKKGEKASKGLFHIDQTEVAA